MIAQLQAIQSDLIGIIIPVLLTSITAMITLVTNSIIRIRQDQKKYNNEQFPAMQQMYSHFKLVLSQIVFTAKDMRDNDLLDDLPAAVTKYVDFQKNPKEYRARHQDELGTIEKFSYAMEQYIKLIGELHQLFKDESIPTIPGFHPIFKRKIRTMLVKLHYYSTLLMQYQDRKCSSDIIKKEFAVRDTALQIADFDQYLKLLDQWIWYF